MVLSADDMGIRKGLDPIFCSDCGDRIGWADHDGFYDVPDGNHLFCEDCAKKPKTEEEDE